MKNLFHPSRDDIQLTTVMYALSDPIRLDIVLQLKDVGELTCGNFRICSEKGKSTMTHHFKVLRDAGVIQTRVDGREHFTSLRRADLDARFPGLLDAVLNSSNAKVGSR